MKFTYTLLMATFVLLATSDASDFFEKKKGWGTAEGDVTEVTT